MFYYIPAPFHPLLLVIVTLIGCLGTYFQAKEEKTNELTNHGIPFISDLGSSNVSGAIFNLFFSLYTFIWFIVITYRFEQIRSRYRFNDGRCLQVANVAIYSTGLISCFGLLLLISFREEKRNDMLMVNIHNAGKWITYSMGLFYVLMQSLFSAFWRDLEGRSILVVIIRVFLSATHLALLIAYVALQDKYMENIINKVPENDLAVIDWVLIFLLPVFTLTFIPEFKKFKHTKLKIEYPDSGGYYGAGCPDNATHMAQIDRRSRGRIEERGQNDEASSPHLNDETNDIHSDEPKPSCSNACNEGRTIMYERVSHDEADDVPLIETNG